MENGIGFCQAYLADVSTDREEKRALYKQAVANFGTSAQALPETVTANTYTVWGLSLFRLGKLDNDRPIIRQSVERLSTAVENDPANLSGHYNLACAFARLDQPDAALRHLRLCLAKDGAGIYREAAANDVDLKSLRRLPEFQEMIGSIPPKSPR